MNDPVTDTEKENSTEPPQRRRPQEKTFTDCEFKAAARTLITEEDAECIAQRAKTTTEYVRQQWKTAGGKGEIFKLLDRQGASICGCVKLPPPPPKPNILLGWKEVSASEILQQVNNIYAAAKEYERLEEPRGKKLSREDVAFMVATAYYESGFSDLAKSRENARGLFQFIGSTTQSVWRKKENKELRSYVKNRLVGGQRFSDNEIEPLLLHISEVNSMFMCYLTNHNRDLLRAGGLYNNQMPAWERFGNLYYYHHDGPDCRHKGCFGPQRSQNEFFRSVETTVQILAAVEKNAIGDRSKVVEARQLLLKMLATRPRQ